jgi:hypothetical protein
MAKIVKIQVTATDNELYILASTPNGSSEICHIKSGFNNPVNYVVVPQSILPAGNYTLTVLGINWGGPSAFKVILTDSTGANTPVSGGAGLPPGGTWSQAISITV